ncbi:MAG: DUF4175 family protein [Deltaproteobacteria bacterium]|nr:DUF4175 family protein [Deltaproteobacteria bacterium]
MTRNRSAGEDYERLSAFLRGVSRRLQLLAACDLLLAFAAALLLVLLGSSIPLAVGKRFWLGSFLYSVVSLALLALLLLRGLRRVFARPGASRVAQEVESKLPYLRDDLTNSLLLYRDLAQGLPAERVSAGLIAAQLRRTADRVAAIRGCEVVRFGRLRSRLRLLLPVAAVFTGVLVLDPPFVGRSLALLSNPLSAVPEGELRISLEPRGGVALRGTFVEVRARTEGRAPDRLYLAVWTEGGGERRLAMTRLGEGSFALRLPAAEASFRYEAYEGRTASPLYSMRVVEPPEITGLKVTLSPPEYAHLPNETRESGNVEGLRGSAVNVEGRANRRISSAELLLDGEGPLALSAAGDGFRGKLVLLDPGRYSLRIRDEFGFTNPNPVRYSLRVLPDRPPDAEVLEPARDLEVDGTEVIPLRYSGRDDFGLTAVKLLYRLGGREYALDLGAPSGARSVAPRVFRWELADLAPTPGEKITYRIAVWDNDSVSGPKAGFSRAFTLSVRDERTRASLDEEEALRLSGALLSLLADHLEELKDHAGVAKGLEELLRDVDRKLAGKEPAVEPLDYQLLRRNLLSLKERLPSEPRETVTQELERLALLAEDIARQARMRELEALARELRNRQQRLVDQLKDLKGNLTREALAAALRELQKLSELLRSVMQAMSQLAPRLPDEFVNSPELADLDFKDFFSELDELRQKLLAGDLEAALAAAERLFQSLSQMMAAMGRAGAQAARSRSNRLGGEMSRQAGELEKLLGEQAELLRETEALDRELRAAAEEGGPSELKERFPSLSARQERLKERTRQLAEKLEALSQLFPGLDPEVLRDLSTAGDSMGEASNRLTGEDAPGAIPPEQEVLRRLNRSRQAMGDMAQQMAMQGQLQPWGQPYGYHPGPGWYYGPWAAMPTLAQPEVKRELERGYTGIEREEFDPPGKDAYAPPRDVREKIVEALKEEVPSRYRREVEAYFRELSR